MPPAPPIPPADIAPDPPLEDVEPPAPPVPVELPLLVSPESSPHPPHSTNAPQSETHTPIHEPRRFIGRSYHDRVAQCDEPTTPQSSARAMHCNRGGGNAMKCKDIMKTPVVACRTTDGAADCARTMREHNVGFVPVYNTYDALAGVVTDRDLVVRLLANELPNGTPLAQLMSTDIVTCHPDDDVEIAERQIAKRHKSRILVVRDKRCVGIISVTDVAQRENAIVAGQVFRDLTRRASSKRAGSRT
jgi:CBS domain-containing protein